jgi:hypothetical protein
MAHLTVMFYNANRGKGGKQLGIGDFFPSLAVGHSEGGQRRASKSDMRTKLLALKSHVRAIRESNGD